MPTKQTTTMAEGTYTREEISTHPVGWICPKCGRVYSPWMMTCLVCSGYIPPAQIHQPFVIGDSPCPAIPPLETVSFRPGRS